MLEPPDEHPGADTGPVVRAIQSGPYGGFKKFGGPFLVVLEIRALLFWGPY